MSKINQQIIKYLDYCKNIRQMSENTILNKRSILRKFVRETKIEKLEDLTNQIHNDWLKKEFSHSVASSMNIYNSAIVSLVKFHLNNGAEIKINLNQIPYFKSIKTLRKFYSEAEINRALSYAGEAEKLMIKIMFETGMRISELVNLKVENFDGAKINFVGKGNKLREVYISDNLLKDIQDYRRQYNIYSKYLWCVVDGHKTISGEPPTVDTIRKKMQRIFRDAGFDGFYPHALRHSFATNLQQKGASVAEIKEMMGHSSIVTTERYLHGFDGRLEELFCKYR